MKGLPAEADFEVKDFERDVLQRSHDVPVLVDFWAAWCGPCRFLGPVVEKLAGEADGRWELVKVDTEANADLAQRYGIRGIPNLKLFHQGKVIAEMSGAMAEPELKQWIVKHLPTVGMKRLAEARALVEASRPDEAIVLLEQVVGTEPGLDDARILLARLLALHRPTRTLELLQHHLHLPDAQALVDIAEAQHMDLATLPQGPARDAVLRGLTALRNSDPDGAMEAWVDAVLRDKSYADDLPRRLCVALFQLLGREHPVTQQWRRRFDMALY